MYLKVFVKPRRFMSLLALRVFKSPRRSRISQGVWNKGIMKEL